LRPTTDDGLPTLSQFRLLRRLGEGGQGAVYEALDLHRQLHVALKIVRARKAEHMLRFKDEFRAARDLHHPNLIQLGELHHERGAWFFTMELVDGVDFLTWVHGPLEPGGGEATSWPTMSGAPPATPSSNPSLSEPTRQTQIVPLGAGRGVSADPARPSGIRRRIGLDERRLRAALRQLAEGLACLHAAGKVHRDLKPSNLLVTPTGRVVLIDFGVIGEVADPDADRGLVVGTVNYMAPEQVRGEHVDAAADWYAVGVLLFEALTGRRPFEGPSDDVGQRKQSLDAPRASELVGDVPPDLDELCARLLARAPGGRPDAAQLLAALGPPDQDAQESVAVAPAPPALFVGRQDELAMLDDAFSASRAHAVALVLEGESGVGKSTIVQRFLDELRVREHRTLVLAGRCHEQERVPYNAFDAAIDGLARELRRLSAPRRQELLRRETLALVHLFPVLQGVVPAAPAGEPATAGSDERLAAFASLRELLARLTRRRRLVLVLEDLQWADRDSLALLEELTREPGAPRLLIVATCRAGTDGSIPALAAFGGELRRRRVGGLARAAAGPGTHLHRLGPLAARPGLVLDGLPWLEVLERDPPTGRTVEEEILASRALDEPEAAGGDQAADRSRLGHATSSLGGWGRGPRGRSRDAPLPRRGFPSLAPPLNTSRRPTAQGRPPRQGSRNVLAANSASTRGRSGIQPCSTAYWATVSMTDRLRATPSGQRSVPISSRVSSTSAGSHGSAIAVRSTPSTATVPSRSGRVRS